MAYKALYRKYRPDSFDSVIGQESIVKTLQNSIKQDKINHAYLFCGPRGIGKTSVAKLFAKSINCLNNKDGLACNNCEICNYLNSDNVTDIIEMDAASNNGVDEIRELKNKVNLAPLKCKYKVYIIDEVHMLSIGAFNALLKTLEEPPAHAIFILATTEIQKIPLTIISRCQNFDFKKISNEKIKSRLNQIAENEKIKIEEEAIDEIAKIADGGFRDAISLLEQAYTFSDTKITINDIHEISGIVSTKKIIEFIHLLALNNVDKVFDYIDEFYNEGKDFIKIVEKIIVVLKNILLYKKAQKLLKNIDNEIDLYKDISLLIEEKNIYYYIGEINKSLNDMKISTYPKILFEIMVLKLIKVDEINENSVEVEGVKDKLESKVSVSKENKKEDSNLEVETENVVFEKYKKALVNNTIALAEKKYIGELTEKWKQLQTYLINKDYKSVATILIDAKIISASEDHVILIFKYDAMIKKFDDMIREIEGLIQKIIGRKYTAVALTENNWLEIRPYYVELKKNKKEITLLPEDEIKKVNNKKEKISKEAKEAIDIFGQDLIEMKG